MKYPCFFKKLNLQKTYLPHNIKVISLEDAIYLVIYLSLKENTFLWNSKQFKAELRAVLNPLWG